MITIGVLIDSLVDSYQKELLNGIDYYLKKNNLQGLYFEGGAFNKNSPDYSNRKVFLYDLLSQKNVDGLIVFSNSIGNYSSKEELFSFLRSLPAVPTVSIGKKIDGFPSVKINNHTGMALLMKHLIMDHGYRKFAFIKGPEENIDAIERLQAFQEALSQHNIPYDEELIIPGIFWRTSGSLGARKILESGKTIDAIVCGNDYTALGALTELQKHNNEEIMITGFDNIPESLYSAPSITTIDQPCFKQGYMAAEMADLMIKGEAVPDFITVEPELVIRRSCGCEAIQSIEFIQEPVIEVTTDKEEQKKESINILNTLLKKELNLLSSDTVTQIYAENMASAFYENLEATSQKGGKRSYSFVKTLRATISDSTHPGDEIFNWERILYHFFKHVNSKPLSSREMLILANIHRQTNDLLRERLVQSMEKEKAKMGQQIELNQRVNISLYKSFDLAQSVNELYEELLVCNIKTCIIGIFTKENKSINRARLLLKIIEGKKYEISSEPFNSEDFLPEGIRNVLGATPFILNPLSFDTDMIGYILFDYNPSFIYLYDSFPLHISNMIKSQQTIQQIKNYSHKLEQDVAARTEELRAAQQRLIEAAHRSGMAEIAIDILHSIGNGLNSILTSTGIIADTANFSRLDRLKKVNELFREHSGNLGHFLSEDSRGEALIKYMGEITSSLGRENLRIKTEAVELKKNISSLEKIIKKINIYANTDLQTADTGIVEAVSSCLQISQQLFDKNKIRCSINAPAEVTIETNTSRLFHILKNIFEFSVTALKKVAITRRLLIDIEKKGRFAEIRIRHTGQAMNKETLNSLFSMGEEPENNLHTTANFLSELGGTIEVFQDQEQRETMFRITLPLKTVSKD